MRNIISYFPDNTLQDVTSLFRRQKNISVSGAGNASSKAMILSQVLKKNRDAIKNILWVVSDPNEQNVVKMAMDVWGDAPVFIYKKRADEEVIGFPTKRDFDELRNRELVEFVSRVFFNTGSVFVVDFPSLLQNFPEMNELLNNKISLKAGAEVDVVSLIGKLVAIGYEMSDDKFLQKGQYYKTGDSVVIRPINSEEAYSIDVAFDKIERIEIIDQKDFLTNLKEVKTLDVFPLEYEKNSNDFLSLLGPKGVVVDDEVDVVDEFYEVWNAFMDEVTTRGQSLSFSSFNDDVENHVHLHFLSVLKYRNAYDFANDMRDKISADWKNIIFTKNVEEVSGLLRDQKVPFIEGITEDNFSKSSAFLIKVDKEDVFPQSFQAPTQRISLVTDTDISFLREEKKKYVDQNVFNDFLTSLKFGDFVVHADHGIAKFMGLDKKTVDGITKEYLKLGYAENDKLFVPIDQADKVNKYIGSEDLMPKLTRLGSADWNTITSKVKKETQIIAKELLKLYAERRAAKGFAFNKDNDLQEKFEKTFPYDETPGQMKAINDVKEDMESGEPMDRLVCGDVGFGKTEVAMRAAFKAVQGGKQVALISPITILADQHYKSFKKRMEEFNVRVDMLSRFKSQKDQKEIVQKLGKGEVDIIIGTHRLLQPDIKFKNLGLVIIDEEQRFGVKQKEALKELRKEVDMLTLTATPIPRTLNICLNKLRDITTITTPPYGRLPIITEVRKYSPSLVREAVMREIERGGQVYFLHNRVQTIDGFAESLRALIPEARIGVAHGKLGSGDLEDRIMAFTEHKFDVLVSSTIIENGIDLANANTLIVNNAEKFGLSQLYQLRGRVGRGKRQAFAYFLYHGQRLKLDAKKRLRAIVEASDLGSGFQIAMKDLEIRGAGDILGANQHGVINVVGVAHFMRMLNKAVEDLKAGRVMEGEEEITDVSIELPVPAYIPDAYIPTSKDKINTYQKLSSADTKDYLNEVSKDLVEDYGKIPKEVDNLFKIIELKIIAKKAGVVGIKAESVPMSEDKEIVLHLSGRVKPANIINMLEYNSKWQIIGNRMKINMKELGYVWFAELIKCVGKLSEKAKHGAATASEVKPGK
ncbi:MAG: transcription-repair coupling factor [Candidatus Peregrinibacteria bacterium]|nr:transcription-repair coupling factor [Candidatus Peregrinibacteria bacterium]